MSGTDVLSKKVWELLIDSETATQGNSVSSSNFGRDSVWKKYTALCEQPKVLPTADFWF